MQGHYQSILPNFEPLTAPGPIQAPPGGQMLGSLSKKASFLMNPGLHALRGLGQDTPPLPSDVPQPEIPPEALDRTISPVVGVIILGVLGFLSYEIGSAMTPSGSKKQTWGLVGIPVGVLTGPIGLGIMGIVSNHRRRG